MHCSNFTSWVSSIPSISYSNLLSNQYRETPFLRLPEKSIANKGFRIHCQLRKVRDRIDSVKNIQRITESVKMVAAAKVRRAQEAVISGRPFAVAVVDFLYSLYEYLQFEDIGSPLLDVRPVKKVALVVLTGEKGLCGSFNNAVINRTESRIAELEELGVDYSLVIIGERGNSYFKRRGYVVKKFIQIKSFPTAKEAQIVADYVYSQFVSEEADKVELVYSKFMSFIRCDPVIQTLLPLSMKGEILDTNGNCVDAMEDELFRLTTKQGKLTVERDRVTAKREGISPLMEFEQDPILILDAMLPLYLNSQILRGLQESLASELASRMMAMKAATDNAVDLRKSLLMDYNRGRQMKITGEISEIVSAADALSD